MPSCAGLGRRKLALLAGLMVLICLGGAASSATASETRLQRAATHDVDRDGRLDLLRLRFSRPVRVDRRHIGRAVRVARLRLRPVATARGAGASRVRRARRVTVRVAEEARPNTDLVPLVRYRALRSRGREAARSRARARGIAVRALDRARPVMVAARPGPATRARMTVMWSEPVRAQRAAAAESSFALRHTGGGWIAVPVGASSRRAAVALSTEPTAKHAEQLRYVPRGPAQIKDMAGNRAVGGQLDLPTSPSARPPAPVPQEIAVDSRASDVRHLVLSRPDGVTFVALWREASVWDPGAQHELNVENAAVRLQLPHTAARADVFHPAQGGGAVGSYAQTDGLDLAVGPGLVLVRLLSSRPQAPGAPGVDQFLDSIGVNVHFTYYDTAYGDSRRVIAALRELGVRHVRDGLASDHPVQPWAFKQLAAAGIRADLIIGNPRRPEDSPEELVELVATTLGGAVSSIEGINEYDHSGDQDWVAKTRAYQERLWNAVRSRPELDAVPVVSPSLGSSWHRSDLGDLSGVSDVGNLHSYPGARAPSQGLNSQIEGASITTGAKPIFATETGYHNALAQTTSHPSISEQAAGTYMPRLYFEYFRRGVRRTFAYELVDEWAEPELRQRESHFGLLRNDFSEKPAYSALRNTIDLLEAPVS